MEIVLNADKPEQRQIERHTYTVAIPPLTQMYGLPEAAKTPTEDYIPYKITVKATQLNNGWPFPYCFDPCIDTIDPQPFFSYVEYNPEDPKIPVVRVAHDKDITTIKSVSDNGQRIQYKLELNR